MKTTINSKVDLGALAQYQNDEVVDRFMNAYEVDEEDARLIFDDMKCFLALTIQYPEEEILLPNSILVIDEMWHTFLMFTRDYQAFCRAHFGCMIHHEPTPKAEKIALQKEIEIDRAAVTEKAQKDAKHFYGLIYDFLGGKVLVRWIEYYGKKYTKEYLNSIRKPI